MDRDSGLDWLIERVEKYRKADPFSTIIVQVRDHEYVHVKQTMSKSESRSIGKAKNEHRKTESNKSMDR